MSTIDKSKFQFVKRDDFASEAIDAPAYSYWGSVFRQFMKKKSTKEEIEEVEETQEDLIAKLVKEKEAKIEREIAMEESEISLEDEIKLIVSKNTDETTELIKTWLNE